MNLLKSRNLPADSRVTACRSAGTTRRHLGRRTSGQSVDCSSGIDEAMPFPIAAATVVFAVVMAVALAVPVESVNAVAGVMVPAPMLKDTATFGTPWPSALSTLADTATC